MSTAQNLTLNVTCNRSKIPLQLGNTEISALRESPRNQWPANVHPLVYCYNPTPPPLGYFWDYRKPLTIRDILASPLSERGFNIHHIHTKIQALWLNTVRRLISPKPAHWKYFTAYFLHLQYLQPSLYTLTVDYKTQDTNPFIPAYHRELLITWNRHRPIRHCILDPASLTDLF